MAATAGIMMFRQKKTPNLSPKDMVIGFMDCCMFCIAFLFWYFRKFSGND
jgi:hypothetical protein